MSLSALLSGTAADIGGDTAVTLTDYAAEIVLSGSPGSGTCRRVHVGLSWTATSAASSSA